MKRVLVLLAISVFTALPAAAQPATAYTNPVLPANFPDPAILRDSDGTYYAFGTQSDTQPIHIQTAASRDLIHWTMRGDALLEKPAWASQRHNFWAPDVHRRGSRYILYFAAEPNSSAPGKDEPGGKSMCLGMATARNAAGPYTDAGQPMLCASGFIDIDPMGFDDPKTGRKLLYWGSGFQPIKVQELAEDRFHFKAGSHPIDLVDPIPGNAPNNYRKLVEGVWTTYHKGWYYLFFSGDNCCGSGAHYAVMTARSRNATGPFQIKPGNGLLLQANSVWLAPGHNSVATDDAGHDWIVYHAIDASHREPGRVMLIDRIVYRHGWPSIQGGTPSTRATAAPSIRRP